MHHAAVDDAQSEPHQHGHDVLGENAGEALFRCIVSPSSQGGAAVANKVEVTGGVEHHQHLLLTVERKTQKLDLNTEKQVKI